MTIFFDADDTLWHTERKYQDKQQEIATYCAAKYQIDREYLFHYIVSKCEEYMAGPISRAIFPETCVDVCARLIQNLSPYDIIHIYRICEDVFNYTPKLKENTVETLIALGNIGDRKSVV